METSDITWLVKRPWLPIKMMDPNSQEPQEKLLSIPTKWCFVNCILIVSNWRLLLNTKSADGQQEGQPTRRSLKKLQYYMATRLVRHHWANLTAIDRITHQGLASVFGGFLETQSHGDDEGSSPAVHERIECQQTEKPSISLKFGIWPQRREGVWRSFKLSQNRGIFTEIDACVRYKA